MTKQRRYGLFGSGFLVLVAHGGFRRRIDDLVAQTRDFVGIKIGKW